MIARRPDRVVIINDRSTEVGGASNLAILSARLLEQSGIPVTFFAGDDAGATKPVVDTINLSGAPLVNQGRMAAFASGLYNPGAYTALARLISQSDTPSTIYHVHGWSKILSPSIFRALSPVRERVVLHAHDYFLACPNGGFANYRTHNVCTLAPMSGACLTTQCDKRGYHEKLWRTARHAMRERFFTTRHMPANLVIVHERMTDYFVRAGMNIQQVFTVRNPVSAFLEGPVEPWKRRKLFFIGRLEPEKGFEDAARAARLAKVDLHIIGDGAGRALLERDYPEITIHGWQSREGIRAIVGEARAIVVSSRVPEPFGLAALEAVSSGLPVIVPSLALLGKELSDLDCGLTFRNGDIASLAEAMRRMSDDDAMVARMSANCLREAPDLAHTTESWGEALKSIYVRVLARADAQRAKGSAGAEMRTRSAEDAVA
jgi:glycosyltransferase involved in cell wall biosynthesis